MSQFKCETCDNNLQLIVKTEEENIYKINTNGEIEFLDNRSVTQKLTLECDECGMTYEFANELLFVEKRPVLRLEDINSYKSKPVTNLDLAFE